jgi:hypothetical protein
MLAISVIMQNPEVLSALNVYVPGAMWVGIKDFVRTFRARTSRATPIGWKYKKEQKVKRGKNKGKTKTGTKKWVRSGKLRKSWTIEEEPQALAISMYTDKPYAGVIEGGAYPNPPTGIPRTNVPWTPWRVDSGYSKQAPGGIVGPLLDDDRLMKRSVNLIVDEIGRRIQESAAGGSS